MEKQFATLLIDHDGISLSIFEADGDKVAFIKNISEKITDPRDHKLIHKTLRDISNNNSDLPKDLFAVWPEFKTLTTVLENTQGLSDDDIAKAVKEKYSLTSQDILTVNKSINDQRSQVTVFPTETRDLYLKYSQELKMNFLGFAPVVLGMQNFSREENALLALKTSNQYILCAVIDGGVYYTETVNSPEPIEFITRLSKAIDFIQSKKDNAVSVKKVILIGFPKSPEIKLPAKISVIRKPLTVRNLTGESKAVYLDSVLSARLVVKDLPQENVNKSNNEEDQDTSSSQQSSAQQLLEAKDKTAMSEEYTTENENEDTLRRLNDSRDYRYYDEETTSWKAWLVGVIIILVVLFLVVGVLARAGYLPFNVPFFSPETSSQNVVISPTPTPQPIVQATPTPIESSPSANVKKDEFTVQVQNGSGKAGAAGVVTKALDDDGYDTVSATNAPTEDYATTEIYNVGKASDDFVKSLIADLKTAGYTATDKGSKLPADVKTSADVLVILGTK